MLARRDLSEGEVRSRLAAKDYAETEIEETVSGLRESGYLDDPALARSLADRSAGRLHGPKKIAAYLETRLLPSSLIRETVAAAFAGGAEREIAARARAGLEGEADRRARRPSKKKGPAADPARLRREFLLRRLLGRGFSWDAALAALEPDDEGTREETSEEASGPLPHPADPDPAPGAGERYEREEYA